jgi:hypothetical protein
MFKRIARKTVELITAHPRITMFAIAICAALALYAAMGVAQEASAAVVKCDPSTGTQCLNPAGHAPPGLNK